MKSPLEKIFADTFIETVAKALPDLRERVIGAGVSERTQIRLASVVLNRLGLHEALTAFCDALGEKWEKEGGGAQ